MKTARKIIPIAAIAIAIAAVMFGAPQFAQAANELVFGRSWEVTCDGSHPDGGVALSPATGPFPRSSFEVSNIKQDGTNNAATVYIGTRGNMNTTTKGHPIRPGVVKGIDSDPAIWAGYIAEFGVWSGINVALPFYTYARAYYGANFPFTPSFARPTAAVKTATLGDSITASSLCTISYPKYLQSWAGAYGNHYYENHGTAGWKIADMKTEYETNIRGQGFKEIFFVGGINNILNNETGASISAEIDTLCNEMCADGSHVRIGTVMPWDTYASWTSGRQTQTDNLNTLIRTEPSRCSCSTVVDLYASMGDPTDAAKLNTFFNSPDGLHPNDPGCEHLASAFLRP